MQHPPGGWIKAHRALFDKPWPILWRHYFLDLVQLAAYHPHAELKRGQLRASYRFLQKRWDVGLATIGRFLARLESDGAIEVERGAERMTKLSGTGPGTNASLITICNYEAYSGTAPAAVRGAERKRNTPRNKTEKGRRGEKPVGSDGKRPHPPSAAAPAKPPPTQRIDWPAELQKVWDYLLAFDLLGTDIDNPDWWAKQLTWIEATGLNVFPLDELKAYIAHQVSQTGSRQHRSRRRGFRNWLATKVRWKERDADREAIRRDERDPGRR